MHAYADLSTSETTSTQIRSQVFSAPTTWNCWPYLYNMLPVTLFSMDLKYSNFDPRINWCWRFRMENRLKHLFNVYSRRRRSNLYWLEPKTSHLGSGAISYFPLSQRLEPRKVSASDWKKRSKQHLLTNHVINLASIKGENCSHLISF